MTAQSTYGATAKAFHWIIVALLLIQFPIGWLMPGLHRGAKPGAAMTFHISFGLTILFLIILRLLWRVTHPVAPEPSLPARQRLASQVVHWLLYALVFATTTTGWLFASFRGWSVSYFFVVPLPKLLPASSAAGHVIDGWHQVAEWSLLIVIGIHIAAALLHLLVYRDRVRQRVLPG